MSAVLHKEDSAAAAAILQGLGLEVGMIIGHNPRTAGAIARKVGISRVLAEVLPPDKALEVERLQGEGKLVGMVGDGINDAPALAQANAGFAVGSCTDVAIESSDIMALLNGGRAARLPPRRSPAPSLEARPPTRPAVPSYPASLSGVLRSRHAV